MNQRYSFLSYIYNLYNLGLKMVLSCILANEKLLECPFNLGALTVEGNISYFCTVTMSWEIHCNNRNICLKH